MGTVEFPSKKTGHTDFDVVECPWCGSRDVEPIGFFSAQLMGRPFMCKRCHSPFERIRKRWSDANSRSEVRR